MQYQSGDSQAGRGGTGLTADRWDEAPVPPRDWKKLVLIIGLGVLSWVATYVGMLELIEANMGDLPLIHKVIIGFSVAMLMTMIVWLLDQLFAPLPFTTKLMYVVGYVFLTAISVGFGFGFYWKVLESRSEASRSAESAVSQVQSALHGASTRLDQLTQTLVQLAALSTQKAEIERATGKSCPNSRPGDGPRRKLRDDDASRFSFSADLVKSRTGNVKSAMRGLDSDLNKIVKSDPSTINPATGTRNDFMNALSRKLDLTVTGYNAFRTDPQLRQIRVDLAARADRSVFPDSRGGTFVCPDSQLSAALKGVVRAIDQLPLVEKPVIAAVEGSEATIEAFRRLAASVHGMMILKMPPSADEQRELQKRAVQSVENPALAARAAADGNAQAGLSKRDYVPLSIALFVDLCLLLVSMGRPINRLGGLVPRMREAERGPVIHILSRFSEIHRDEKIRESFEVLRHVVFDYTGAYYVAVPLDAPFTETRTEQVIDPRTRKSRLVRRQFALSQPRREELRVEAHLIGNLFSSFEKDAVFKRVMWLNTAAARKQLHRQGSKFANAEAFRIYRFNDGAWSEIILGAVMGAARRVEARRAIEPDQDLQRQPSLDMLVDRMRRAEDEAASDSHVPRPKPVYGRDWAPAQAEAGANHAPANADNADADTALLARFGPYADRARQETMLDPVADRYDDAREHANSNTQTGGHAASRGTQAAAAGSEPSLRDTIRHHATNGAAGGIDQPAGEAANVVPFKNQPRGAADFEQDDARLPNIIARGQTSLAVADHQPRPSSTAAPLMRDVEPHTNPEPHVDAGIDAVTVTATERKLSFSLPMNDPRLDTTLYGVAGVLGRTATAAGQRLPAEVPPAAQDAAATQFEVVATAEVETVVEPAQTQAVSTAAATAPAAAAHRAGADRYTVLSLPGPTMKQEVRG